RTRKTYQFDALHIRYRNSRLGLFRTRHGALRHGCGIWRMAALVSSSALRGHNSAAALRSFLPRNGQAVALLDNYFRAMCGARRQFFGPAQLQFFAYRQLAAGVAVRRAGVGTRRRRAEQSAVVGDREPYSLRGVSIGCRGSTMAEGR